MNLRDLYSSEINQNDESGLDVLNIQTLKTVQSDMNRPIDMGHRIYFAPASDLQNIMNVVKNHPVVGLNVQKYERGDSSLGFCFGRATYLHLLFLKLGLQKNSIEKIWALGHILDDKRSGYWQFHVATMVYTQFQGWVVLDINVGYPMTVADWMQYYQKQNDDRKIRFYYTDPSKFGPSLGRYDRIQLGLDTPVELDWYKHYFKDMMSSLKNESLEQLGLQHF